MQEVEKEAWSSPFLWCCLFYSCLSKPTRWQQPRCCRCLFPSAGKWRFDALYKIFDNISATKAIGLLAHRKMHEWCDIPASLCPFCLMLPRFFLIPSEQFKEWKLNLNVAFTWCLFLAGLDWVFISFGSWLIAEVPPQRVQSLCTGMYFQLFLQPRNAAKCSKPRKKNIKNFTFPADHLK